MRSTTAITCCLAALLSACASLPEPRLPDAGALASIDGATPGLQAAAQANHSYLSQQAQLNDIREAEARVDLARARLDFATVRNQGAKNGDVREFLDARRALRQTRNVFGPTDTGRRSVGLRPFGYGGHWPRTRRHWSNEPVGTFGLSVNQDVAIGSSMPLSMQSGNRE